MHKRLKAGFSGANAKNGSGGAKSDFQKFQNVISRTAKKCLLKWPNPKKTGFWEQKNRQNRWHPKWPKNNRKSQGSMLIFVWTKNVPFLVKKKWSDSGSRL